MCTNIKLTANNGDIFFGRTMDLNISMFEEDDGLDLDVKIVTVSRNTKIMSQLNAWISKYDVLGVSSDESTILYDGINEHGLSGDCQVLVEATTDKLENIESNMKIPLIGEEFVTYILTNFKSVKEVRENYKKFVLVDVPYEYKNNNLHFPLHYTFIDVTGDGIVLEPVLTGGFKLYDYIDVMTNSPEYNFHTVNIRNYIGLENNSVMESKISDGLVLKPIENGTGYGLLGMPGDYTSPSRFIRSFYYKNMIDSFAHEKGINTLYSIFRPVIVPRGLEHENKADRITDYTRYWSGYDLTNRTLYIQTGEGLAITSKNLTNIQKDVTYFDVITTDNIYII